MAELLLELFSEEIPAGLQARAADDLKRLVTEKLKAEGLSFDKAETCATPRRLTLVIDGLPVSQPDISEERRGPRADAPEKAIEGFLKSAGITRDQAQERAEAKGTFLYAVIEKKGRATAEVIADFMPGIIRNFPWPKSQRWGAGSLRWVRPLHSILCILDGTIVDFDIDGIKSGNVTYGHRFMAPDPIQVAGFADYQTKLHKAKVVLDAEERKNIIWHEAIRLTADHGCQPMPDGGLLAEVAGLVEWPVVIMGDIDSQFMELPGPVLAISMRNHQKYFAVFRKDAVIGKGSQDIAPPQPVNHFIAVANIESDDAGRLIREGYERVLRARLSDAKFFWDQDQKISLEDRLPALNDIIFHARLGTLAERVNRMEQLAGIMAAFIPDCDKSLAQRATRLSKADLTTQLVGEFPELQGLVGMYYSYHSKEHEAVSNAISEHYSPVGPSDICPTKPVSVAVALAEKIDTLVGFFAIDEKPTGSKDPFALRRAALGVIRLIVENGLRVELEDLFEKAIFLHGVAEAEAVTSSAVADLLTFIADRLKVQQREQGVRHDLIDAVFSLGGEDDLVRLLARVQALGNFLGTDDGANLLAAYKRASNILRIEEKKDNCDYTAAVAEKLLEQQEEKALHAAIEKARAAAKTALHSEKFEEAMAALATLRAPVDAFFDQVTVNAENQDLRRNRLAILSQIRDALGAVADFSKIEG